MLLTKIMTKEEMSLFTSQPKGKYGQKVVKIQDTTIKSILLQKVNQRYQLTP